MNLNHFGLVIVLIGFTMMCITACNSNKQEDKKIEQEVITNVPVFDADSAWAYVNKQVEFGPRVPGTLAHRMCGDYLVRKLKEFGATVIEQTDVVEAFDGTQLNMRNIIGSYAPENRKRILLCAHWDCRPWADNDIDPKNHRTPVLGANDGASGVGVLLEIARQIQKQAPLVGIDIIFFDVEDYGVPQFLPEVDGDGSWCLGSQYWSKYPHVDGYNARFGILLDMVGGKEATFYVEGFSKEYASSIVDKVWGKAHQLGYASQFPVQVVGYITDDHLPVNRIARIPCIDIIPMMPYCEQSSFGPTWHTVNDNMENIDVRTLKAVGQTVTEVIYNEK